MHNKMAQTPTKPLRCLFLLNILNTRIKVLAPLPSFLSTHRCTISDYNVMFPLQQWKGITTGPQPPRYYLAGG